MCGIKTMKNQELEVKFYVLNLQAVEERLMALDAQLVQPRILETNLRFDTPEAEFTQAGRAIRLRQDSETRLTYKGPGTVEGGARLRQEIEFTVADFEAARDFLLALGYQISVIYEKYRTTYDLLTAHVTLDQMPYGDFIEIEGSDPGVIQAVARLLNLNWETRIADSYTVLFARLQVTRKLSFRDLTFLNFLELEISAGDLEVQPSDR